MTWFKVDDKSAFHEKVIAAGDAAWGLFCRAGAWSSGHATDGLVPSQIARTLCPLRSRWDALVAADLIYRSADGYVIRGFLKWNPSAEEVAKKRESRAIAGRNGGISSGHARSKREAIASPTVEAPCFNKNEPPSRPVPSRPRSEDPPVSPPSAQTLPAAPVADAKPSKSTKGTRCPDAVDPGAPAWLDDHGIPSLSSKFGADVALMLDHFAAQPGAKGVKVNWAATWRNWAKSPIGSHPVGPADGHEPAASAYIEPAPPPMTIPKLDPGAPIEESVAGLLRRASGQ